MMTVPENFRVLKKKDPILGTEPNSGNNGFFVLPHFRIDNYFINAKASDGRGWEHVSVTIMAKHRNVDRCPTWEEMCFVKNTFWQEADTVFQIHPPKSEYVNMHKTCLHLWRPLGIDIPIPNHLLVGLKEVENISPVVICYPEEIYNFIVNTMPMFEGPAGIHYEVGGSWQRIAIKPKE